MTVRLLRTAPVGAARFNQIASSNGPRGYTSQVGDPAAVSLDVVSKDQGSVPASRPLVLYRERLWVPWWWWPLVTVPFALIALELHWGRGIAWIPYVVLLPVPIWMLLWLSRHIVEVRQGTDGLELWADQAHISAAYVSRAAAVPPSAKSATLGRNFDPSAYVSHRPWLGTMVVLVLDDPDDPTPYWLVSAKRPTRVIEALGF